MRILFDLRCLETASAGRGVGRYTREIVAAVRAAAPPSWSFAGLSWTPVARRLGIEPVLYPGPRRAITFADRVMLPGLLRRAGVDLYHATAYPLPVGGVRGVALVLTVHDLVAELHPEALSVRHRFVFRRLFRSAAVAQRVITVSETTRRELLARYRVEPARVVAVHNGVTAALAADAPDLPRSRFPRPFVLYAGGLDALKNVPLLLRALELARRRHPDLSLVVVGEDGPRAAALAARARRARLGRAVVVAGHVDDRLLAAAYAEATAFVFPSRYEGFGLPPLEAMAAGCPVVSTPCGALREVLGEAAWLASPDDPQEWAHAISTLAADPEVRGRFVEAGRRRAAAFSWRRAGEETVAVYRAALEEAGRA